MISVKNGTSLVKSFKRNPAKGPRFVFITGGTGSRFVAQELLTSTYNATYIIGTADSGGSTRELRKFFNMPGIGDFRSRYPSYAMS